MDKNETKEERNTRHKREALNFEMSSTSEELQDIVKSLQLCIGTYKGDLAILESSIGAYFLAKLYGWKILRMIHTERTYKKYESVLGLKFSDVAPDFGVLKDRANVWHVHQSVDSFWSIVRGEVPVAGGRTSIDPDLMT